MNPRPYLDWTPKSLITALRNAEAKLRNAQGGDDSNDLNRWQVAVDTYRSMARRHSIQIER